MESPLSPEPAENNLNTANTELILALKGLESEVKSGAGGWTLLLVTLILFFSAGVVTFKPMEILILIGVLFVHELGHMLSMKIMKYSDVKMFFIPLIGAAVSGKSREDSALKSCVVSMLGPFPGILLGALFFILFLFSKQYYLLKTAEVMLILNTLNLLPIMPLDGGRYVDTLFVNNRYFRLVFALGGAGVFFLLGFASNDFIIVIIGILSLFTSINSYKLNAIAHELKRDGVSAASVNELLDHPERFEQFITRMKSRFPKLFHPRLHLKPIHSNAGVVVDNLKFKPAGMFTKTILILTYLAVLTVALFVTFLAVGMNYKEDLRIQKTDAGQELILDKYAFGMKRAQYALNPDYRYHGKGVGFFEDGKTIDSEFTFDNGFRDGEWRTFDRKGVVIEKTVYEKGRLIYRSDMRTDDMKITTREELSFFRRVVETIMEMSQPYRSHHEHYRGKK